MSSGEFTFGLVRKLDRNGKPYLFGSIRMFNAVIFIRENPSRGEDDAQRWTAIVKPYTGPRTEAEEDFEDSWTETPSGNQQHNNGRGRK